MKIFQVTIRNTVGREEFAFLRGINGSCVICGSSLIRHELALSPSSERINPTFDVIYLPLHCSNEKCGRINISRYTFAVEPDNIAYYDLSGQLVAVEPEPHIDIPDNVKALSPRFIHVYKQALASEGLQLQELIGVGLRKALEILVKDYAISRCPDERERVEAQFIGPCIQEFLDDRYLRESAKRASWLGNDETHYRRKWTEHDISDMKRLIKITLTWLNFALQTERYLEEIELVPVSNGHTCC